MDQEKKVDKKRRTALAQAFMRSEFYTEFFEPEIQQRIEDSNKISAIPDVIEDKEILLEFKKRKYKVVAYRSLLNKIRTWAEEKSQTGGK